MTIPLTEILVVLVIIFNILLGLLVYVKDRKKIVNFLFLALTLSVSLWSFASLMSWIPLGANYLDFWSNATFWGPALFIAFFLYFSFIFPQEESFKVNAKKLLLILIPAFVVIGLAFFQKINIKTHNPWTIERGYGMHVFTGYLLTYLSYAFLNLYRKMKTTSGLQKKQVLFVLNGFLIAIFVAVFFNLILPLLFDYAKLTLIGPIASGTIFLVFITYAIIKHHLFSVKIIATELLIAALWLFTLIRTLISETIPELMINASFLWVTIIIGIFLIKSVINEVKNREETEKLNQILVERKNKLETLAKKLQEANDHLKELMDIKTEFLQIASHQLRTPLTSLRGFLSMQAEGDLDKMPEKDRKGLQADMLTVANNLNNIVNDLLHATELDGGSINFEFKTLQVQDLIEEAVKTFNPSYEKKGLKIDFKRNESLPEIEADEGYIRQVFLNIINNAEKYTQKGGLTITSSEKEGNIEIVFKDTGIGIDPGDIDKLFGKFVRGNKAALIHTDGSGLGLYIIKKIVDEHGGNVSLTSEGVGKGTTVSIRLPINQ